MSIGGQQIIPIVGVHTGFDWDDGITFLQPEVPVRAASDAFRREQKMTRQVVDELGWVWLTVTSKQLDDKQKVAALKLMFHKRNRRGG